MPSYYKIDVDFQSAPQRVSVAVPRIGPKGDQGEIGLTGSTGATGATGAPGADGRDVELQTTTTHIQWRYVGEAGWNDLVALSAITGPQGTQGVQGEVGATGAAGADGREVELQQTATHVQWRYEGDVAWTNLIPLADITGPTGATGPKGDTGGTIFIATHNQPPANAFATLDTRNSIAVLDFDDATTESALFFGIIPQTFNLSSGLVVSLRWMATSATSGNVRWSVAFEKSTTDLDSDSFDTATAATATTSGTSGIAVVTDITCTNIDGIVAGDLYRVRIQRLGGDEADTMSGDAELVAVEIRSAA